MKILIAGGTGHIGAFMVEHWKQQGHDVVVLSRGGTSSARVVNWDGKSDGPWMNEIDGADVVLNLAGRTVNCRYTPENLKQMMDSRVDSTRAIGRAIHKAQNPPRVWLQMSTATIYAHRFDAANDEDMGIIGGSEPDAPAYWKISIDIAQAWENAQKESLTPRTRQVALRTSMVMGQHPESVLGVLKTMTHLGLGGAIAGGKQFVSWIHEIDFARALDYLIANDSFSGPVNVCSPNPIPQKEFMRVLRKVLGVPIGLPAAAWMVKIGAIFMKTDAELILKSRRVVPTRLLRAGFTFQFPKWEQASTELIKRNGGHSDTSSV